MFKLSKLINYGIYTLAFLLPIQTRYIFKYGELNNGPWEYGTISIYCIDILIIILLLITIFKKTKPCVKNIYNSHKIYYWLIAGLVIVSLISILATLYTSIAIFSIIKLLLGLSVFHIILNNNFDKLKLWYYFIFGATIQAGIGIFQFTTQSSPANKWLGMAMHTAKELGTSVVEVQASDGVWERWMRAYGGLDHPNILGGLLSIALLITIILFIKNRINNKNQLITKFKTKQINKQELIYYIAIAITTAGLFVSLSRASWIAFGIGLIILLIQQRKHIKQLIAPLIIIIIIAGGLFTQYKYIVLSRFDDMHRVEVTSVNERLDYISNAKKLITNYGITGVGIGIHGLAVQQNITSKQVSYWYQPVHNVPLLIWVEIGIIGVILFITIFILLFIKIIKQIKLNSENKMYLPIIISLGIMIMLDHWLWSLHFGNIFLWLLTAMMLKDTNKDTNTQTTIDLNHIK